MSTGPQFPQLSPVRWALTVVCILGIIGIVYVMLGVAGITVPYWVVLVFWIVVAVAVCAAAIRFIAWLCGY